MTKRGKRTVSVCPTLKRQNGKLTDRAVIRGARRATKPIDGGSIRSYLTLTLPNCFHVPNGIQCTTQKRGRTGFDLRFRPRRHAEDDSLAS